MSQPNSQSHGNRIARSLGVPGGFPATLARYVAVGGTSAACEVWLFQQLYGAVGLPLLAANVIAVCVVTAGGFVGQKLFTFRQRGHTAVQMRLFAVMLAMNFCLNNLLVLLLVEYSGLASLHAKLLQLAVSFLFNFSFARFLVFRQRQA